jgi:hypothetical protein
LPFCNLFFGVGLIVGYGALKWRTLKRIGASENAINWNKSQLLSGIERGGTVLAMELSDKGENVNSKRGNGETNLQR